MSTFVLSSFNEEDLVLKMNECQQADVDKNKKFILNYGTVRFPLTRTEKEQIEATWKAIEEEYQVYEDLEKIDFDQKSSANKSLVMNKLRSLEGYESIVSKLLQIYYSLILENPGRAEKYMDEIIRTPLVYSFLNNYYPYMNENIVLKKITQLVEFIYENSEETNRFKLFKIKMALDSNKFFKDQDKGLFELPSFNSMTEILSSPNFGAKILNIWLPWSIENYPKAKVDEIFKDKILKADWKEFSALRYYFVEEPTIRENLYIRLSEILKGKDFFGEVLFYEVYSNKNWKSYFNSKIDKFSINSLKSRRNLYQRLIKENKGIAFAVFNLFKMGDYSREYFIKLLALKSYGISTTTILPFQ